MKILWIEFYMMNKNINYKIFTDYNPSFSAKDLYEANQAKNKEIVMLVNDALIDLGNTVNTNTIREKENPEKNKQKFKQKVKHSNY